MKNSSKIGGYLQSSNFCAEIFMMANNSLLLRLYLQAKRQTEYKITGQESKKCRTQDEESQ